jgi:ATP-dependent Lon protease
VGGIKEKVLAAKRAGITKIILPEKNKKDLIGIKENYLTGIDFVFAKNITDVVNTALTKKIFNQ